MEVVFRAGGGIEQDPLGLGAFGFGGGAQRVELGAGAGRVHELQDLVEQERGAVEQPAFAEDLAGDHVLEAVAGKLLADFLEGFENVVDLLLDVRMREEIVFLAIDGFVERAALGFGKIVGDDDDDVEIRAADHAAGAFFGAGHAVGHLVGDVAGDQESGVAEQARQCLTSLKAILESIDHALDDVVKVNLFLTDLADIEAVDKVYATFFPGGVPARRTVGVAALPDGAAIQIDAVVSNAEGTAPAA